LRLVAAGHTNRQIARPLGISEGTVRKHLENIYARLQVSSRTAAVTRAFPDRAAGWQTP
jgi:DNA-binding NarL/FixJ family response regulator